MALALFDLDNTLLDGDSDHAWGMYLADIGVVDANEHKHKQDYYYQRYLEGTLDILEFLNFQLAVLTEHSLEQLLQWRGDFVETVIRPMVAGNKLSLIEHHRRNRDDLLIITATNDFVTRPIADLLGIETLIATTAEFVNGAYTGRVSGTPCFQEGKVTRLNQWLQNNRKSLSGSWFYSDSMNDLPLLERVDNPVAVTPDDRLREHAEKLHWPIID